MDNTVEINVNSTKESIQTIFLCSASEIGKHIVNECLKRGYNINTFKLEKLLVIAYGIYLCRTGKKLFQEEIEIWKVGPMIRKVDRDFLKYAISFEAPFATCYLLLEDQEKVINEVVKDYGDMDSWSLKKFGLDALVECNEGRKTASEDSILDIFKQL